MRGHAMQKPNVSSEYSGKQDAIRTLKLPPLEVWENQYQDKRYEIELCSPEFNSICPLTGLPDFGTITITYEPRKWCVELKSFKFYMTAYRTIGIFQEHAANRILSDFVEAVQPAWIRLEAFFTARGGITTKVRCSWPEEEGGG